VNCRKLLAENTSGSRESIRGVTALRCASAMLSEIFAQDYPALATLKEE